MAYMETPARSPVRPPATGIRILFSATWQEEIEEVLASAGEVPSNRPADPDWQAAAGLLLRHCQDTLGCQAIS